MGIDYKLDGAYDNVKIAYGVSSFDNIGKALMTILMMVTTDNWEIYTISLMDADTPIIGGIFSCVVIIFGSYFLLNLVLAVIISAFIKMEKGILSDILNEQKLPKL
jgi:hypothetical protein